MIPGHLLAIAIGFVLDRIIGDPPHWPHPVRWIGTLISAVTSRLNKGEFRFLKGTYTFFLAVGIVFIITLFIVGTAYRLHFIAGVAIESMLIAIGLAQKSLRNAAVDVYRPLANGEIEEARTKLSWIVGRDTERLSESEIARGTIETVSENIADGITSPLFWAFLLGAPGLWLYKTVNTLDSMIGYKDERYLEFGAFSAKADDVLNYIPARITGLFILFFTKNEVGLPFRQRFSGWKQDARKHPSPNSGYLEAATAWQLGVTLGGQNTYRGVVSNRPQMGPGITPLRASHIQLAIQQLYIASCTFWLMLTMIGVLIYAIA